MAIQPRGRRPPIRIGPVLASGLITVSGCLPVASREGPEARSRVQPLAIGSLGPRFRSSGPDAPRSDPQSSRHDNQLSAPGPQLPCPLGAGWETLLTLHLPRQDSGGEARGGFSALAYSPNSDLLELLSDAPKGVVQRWSGLRQLVEAAQREHPQQPPTLRAEGLLALHSGPARLPEQMDGEGLVRLGEDLWVASEGRRTSARPAQLLRFDAATGALLQALPLPAAWQAEPGRGLAANQGPEALAFWRQRGRPNTLLMANETALLQDHPGQVRLLAWEFTASNATARPLGSLALPGAGRWALTELLVVPQPGGATGLLALVRRFEEPDRWGARLLLYSLPSPTGTSAAAATGQHDAVSGAEAMPPRHSWDLLASGPGQANLPKDNWEGLAWGPSLADGRASLLLVSDDNFNPWQASVLAVLAPRRLATCPAQRH